MLLFVIDGIVIYVCSSGVLQKSVLIGMVSGFGGSRQASLGSELVIRCSGFLIIAILQAI